MDDLVDATDGDWATDTELRTVNGVRELRTEVEATMLGSEKPKASQLSDVWIGPTPLYIRFPKLFSIEKSKDCVVADRLFMMDGWVCGQWDWTRNPTGSEEVGELRNLLQLCLEVQITTEDDRVDWKGDDLNVFTVKGIKEHMSVNTYEAPEFVLGWSRLVPKKVTFVAWRAALTRLPTFDALEKRNIPVVSNICPFCGEIEESVEHIFILCGVAQSVWCVLAQWCKVPNLFLFCFLDILNAYKFLRLSKAKAEVFQGVCLIATWCLWKKRNDIVHNGTPVSISSLVEEVKVLGYLWIKNRGKKKGLIWKVWSRFNV
ncbi:uncharacterized protein LOC143557043 [Bidens hawaiensis]|uniref:uncharacterized protein LOC143557043 n=1 Tax=Bidens hawaiensis TaxID=980011 RepID=UPI00404A48B4